MNFCDLKSQYLRYQSEIDEAMAQVLDKAQYVFGPQITDLERSLCLFLNSTYAATCANGTDALYLALKAAGIGHKDEVLTTPFTFFATAETIVQVGAKPVWVDIDPADFNINPTLIEEKITPATKAIIAVSLFGLPAEFEALREIAHKHHLVLIEDAAQSLGALYKGERSGALGDLSTTSFFPAKPLGCFGDGGALFTNDDIFYQDVLKRKNHGQGERYKHDFNGVNSRLDTLQAAVLSIKLSHYEEDIRRRQQIALTYIEELREYVQTPSLFTHKSSVWAQFTLRTQSRLQLTEHLQKHQIPFAIHYPIPLHQQKAMERFGKIELPEAEKASEEVISLPMSADLTESDQTKVIETVKDFFRG